MNFGFPLVIESASTMSSVLSFLDMAFLVTLKGTRRRNGGISFRLEAGEF